MLAYVTGVFLLLLTAHVIVQYAQSVTENVPFSEEPGLGRWLPHGDVWIPVTHGYLYLIYVICALDLWFRRHPAGRAPGAQALHREDGAGRPRRNRPGDVVRRRALGDRARPPR